MLAACMHKIHIKHNEQLMTVITTDSYTPILSVFVEFLPVSFANTTSNLVVAVFLSSLLIMVLHSTTSKINQSGHRYTFSFPCIVHKTRTHTKTWKGGGGGREREREEEILDEYIFISRSQHAKAHRRKYYTTSVCYFTVIHSRDIVWLEKEKKKKKTNKKKEQ